jgi:hypothetical protein
MNNDIPLTVILLVLTILVSGIIGYELCERKHCVQSGGLYSYDYGACIRGQK